ncbi:MAG: hypothetical protein ACYC5O_05290 [Anaerolineae bacterium]
MRLQPVHLQQLVRQTGLAEAVANAEAQ